jgi:PAS domain S-box-containing protein
LIDHLGKWINTWIWAAIVILIGAIFIFDVVTPLSLVVWTLYLIPLFLTLYVRQRLAPFFVAFIIVILSITGIFLSYPDVPINNALVNRVFFSMVIVVIAFFIWNYSETASDLAKRKDELQRTHELLENHIGNSPLAVIEFDGQFRITRWTGEAPAIFGWFPDEVIGKAIGELPWVYEQDAETVTAISAEMLNGKSSRNMHANRNYRKDGTVIFCEWYNSALRDSEGKLLSILSQVLDVTGRTHAEAALRGANTELSAANEELTAMHEELRQNLDELGKREQELTVKNEEMNTLNEELVSSHEELSQNVIELGKAEKSLEVANEVLEQRVADRTVRLEKALDDVRSGRQQLYNVLETLPVYVCLLDADYYMPFANKYFRETFGESHGHRCYEFLFNLNEPCETCETYTVMKTKAPHHWFWTGPNERDYDIYDFPFIDTNGSFLILEMGIDITERNMAVAALQEAHDILEIRVQERTTVLRQKNEELDAINEELSSSQEELLQSIEELGVSEETLRKNEAELKESLLEKEALLSEIHHRVKNNLTAFISLLSLEGAYQNTPEGRELRLDLQNRARSMALVHETLYRTKKFSQVDMDAYLSTLVTQIATTFPSPKPVNTTVSARSTTIDIARATPCGLIINELMTNSFKHAFPEDAVCGTPRADPCTLNVEFTESDGYYTLAVSDNGIGLPTSVDIKTTQSLGLKLVYFLAKHQLQATVEVKTTHGTKFTIRFKS